MVIEKYLYIQFRLLEETLLNSYLFLTRMGQSDERALGLGKNDAVIELAFNLSTFSQYTREEKQKLTF